jgi:LmbE family N-acetylglucosaminyl deacetylase
MQTEEKLIPFHATDPTGRRVLVLAPHPDDETIGCGGTLVLHARAGDPVKIVFLTNGAKGDSSGEVEKSCYVALRQKEAKQACATMGVIDLEFWPFEDRSLSGVRGALLRMVDLLNHYRPQRVYAPSPLEFHPDHRATCFLLCDAIGEIDFSFEVAFYEVNQPIRVNTLVDITPVLGRKHGAMDTYESQLREQPYGDIVLGLNRYRSMTLPEGATHAEGFALWHTDLIQKVGVFSLPFQEVHRLAPDPRESGPLVSVIVRTKDRPHLLAGAIKSIAEQTYVNLEIVVVNDGGQPVQDVVEILCGNIPVQYVHHEKCTGRASAANSGLKTAKGQYINFLDDDDVFYPQHVACLVNHLELTREKVAYSNVLNVFFEGCPETPGSRGKEELVFNFDFDPDRLLFENYIPIMSVLFSKAILEHIKGFSEGLTLFEDWDFWMRASRHFPFQHVDRTTAEYRFYGTTGMANSHRMKYGYDQAREIMFDRALPHMNGRSWAAYQKGIAVRAEKPDPQLNARANGPVEAVNVPPAVLNLDERLQHNMAEMVHLEKAEQQLRLKIADLECRIGSLSPSRLQEESAGRLGRIMAALLRKAGTFYRQSAEKGVDRSKPSC